MSPKKECPNCAVEIDNDKTVCPICQYEFPQQKSKIIWIGLILITLALIYPVYSFLKKIISSF
jgi:RNA polymerase subunit RPABC4/transcription elongation factor Spt4